MSDWAAKVFWKTVTVVPLDSGWTVHLDDRPLRTPVKSPLVLPTETLAQTVAGEWRAQSGLIQPLTMPATQMSNSAIDKVAPQRLAVADMLAAYGQTDLLCHRADGPPELAARQAKTWDPYLTWAAQGLGAPLLATQGIMPTDQPRASLAVFRDLARAMTDFQLAAFHDLVSLSGSVILGLAATQAQADVAALWAASRLDEAWQIEQWGRDDLADSEAAIRRAAFVHACTFYRMT